jgi:catechol 2,3-dioxygenase-like lactoylglutathione lyase family enzyme
MQVSTHHYAVSVGDLEESVAFYEDVVGLDVVEEFSLDSDAFHTVTGTADDAPCDIAFLQAGDGGLVELLDYDTDGPNVVEGVRNSDVGASHLCFEVEDIDEAHDSLPEDVERISGPVAIGERSLFYFFDPDGNVCEFIEETDPPIGG